MDLCEVPRRGTRMYRRLLILIAIWCTLTVRAQLGHAVRVTRTLAETAEQPFAVVWNVNTLGCQKFKIDVNVSKYGILENKENDDQGKYVSLLNRDYGYWPFVDTQNNSVHGGVPQAGNLSHHLAKFRADVERDVPADFKGLGVIDFENWFPIYDQYYGNLNSIYHNLSYQLVKKEHPDWPDYAIKELAKVEFEQGGKAYYLETLKAAQEVRPGGLWGHYHYPKCFNYRTSGRCDAYTHTWNDQAQWLANASDALYPSGYFRPNQSDIWHRSTLHANAMETVRWRQQTGDVHKPIYAYTRLTLVEPSPYYSWLDLVNSIGQTADLGLEGNVVWGDKLHQQSLAACQQTKAYIDGTFGPYVQAVLEFTVFCSRERCSSHGRCALRNISMPSYTTVTNAQLRREYTSLSRNQVNEVLPSMDVVSAELLRSSGARLLEAYRLDHRPTEAAMFEMYQCRCARGWTGDSCQNTNKH